MAYLSQFLRNHHDHWTWHWQLTVSSFQLGPSVPVGLDLGCCRASWNPSMEVSSEVCALGIELRFLHLPETSERDSDLALPLSLLSLGVPRLREPRADQSLNALRGSEFAGSHCHVCLITFKFVSIASPRVVGGFFFTKPWV